MSDDEDDNVIQFRPRADDSDDARSDDELVRRAAEQVAAWKDAGTPTLDAVQDLFWSVICDDASPMARDKIIDAVLTAFGTELGGRRALAATWTKLTKIFAAQCAQDARKQSAQPAELTPEEKAAIREGLWPTVRELAESPDLMDRVVKQVEAMGVVGETELIKLIYIAATSRVLQNPNNILIKGVSSGGKSYTALNTLQLISPEFVNTLTSSSALSLVYDTRPLAHTVMVIFEATKLQEEKQSDSDSTFSMLLRTLLSEGRIVHQTTVEDPDSPTGRRVERIIREGPISLVTTTTGELYNENETRMLSWHIHEDSKQTKAVMNGLGDRAAGTVVTTSVNLEVWHDLQRWIALGPNDVVIPFARQITEKIPPLMVRFRRDVGSLLTFVKASALLHQAQRQIDARGRVVAVTDDYVLAHQIFSKVMAESSGKAVPDNVRAVVAEITKRGGTPAAKPEGMRFTRVEAAGHAAEVVVSREQVGTAIGVGAWSAYRAILAAIDLGFLVNNETRKGKPFRLVLKHNVGEADLSLLPDPRTILAEGGVV